MKKMSSINIAIIACLAFASLLCFANKVYAIEALRYSDTKKISISLRLQIDNYLKKHSHPDSSLYSISSVDLNNDGILEHALKQKSCANQKTFCSHLILAEQGDEIIELSEIKARSLVVGGTYSYGVKNLLGFKNKINDYDYDIYMWSPQKKMYILETDKIRN